VTLVIKQRTPNVSLAIQIVGTNERFRVSHELAEFVSVVAAPARVLAQ
jgi:hypothetical protein